MVCGRKEITIDWKRVDALLAYGCLGADIAATLGIHRETLYNRVMKEFNISFSDYSAQKKAVGDSILREVQFKKAIGETKDGDNTLLIWLGKQRLGQRENEVEKKVSEDVLSAFSGLMEQLDTYQSARKIEDKSNNNETKSE